MREFVLKITVKQEVCLSAVSKSVSSCEEQSRGSPFKRGRESEGEWPSPVSGCRDFSNVAAAFLKKNIVII